jgi:hypothetical protein
VVKRALTRRVVVSLGLACFAVGGVIAAGAALRPGHASSTAASSATTTTTLPRTTTTTLPPTTTTTIPALQQPPPANLPPLPPGGLGPGSRGLVVSAFERRMADVKLDPGPIDGVYDQATMYAVQTVEKLASLPRTGRIGEPEAQALTAFQYPQPLHATAEPNRTEIDVTKQVLTLYQNYQVRLITTTSTASGVHYCYDTPLINPTEHVCEVATTPSGRFTYYLFKPGWDKGVLGALYNPFYFNKGIAVHGYQDVPPEPASHGCARIPMHISEYFHTLVNNGDPVYVDGGQPAQVLSSTRI